MLLTMMMKGKRVSILLAACAILAAASLDARSLHARPSDESEVRGVVQTVFDQLRSGRYGELYDVLPAASRSRISRDRFVEMLRRSSGMYKFDRIEIGAVRVSGDIAAVDTVMYGSVSRPVQAEGKIVAQQYLVREDGRWRVSTGDQATVRRFLAANPSFAKKFPIRELRVYVKREGKWIDQTKALRFVTRGRAGR
jgi:hypothetical protein